MGASGGYDSDLFAILVVTAGIPALLIAVTTAITAAVRRRLGLSGDRRAMLAGLLLVLLLLALEAVVLAALPGVPISRIPHAWRSEESVLVSPATAWVLAVPPVAVLLGGGAWLCWGIWKAWRGRGQAKSTGRQPDGSYVLTPAQRRAQREAEQYRRREQGMDAGSMMDVFLLFVAVPAGGLVAYFAFNLDAVIVAIMAALAVWGILAKPGSGGGTDGGGGG